jgi:hypothetical protein
MKTIPPMPSHPNEICLVVKGKNGLAEATSEYADLLSSVSDSKRHIFAAIVQFKRQCDALFAGRKEA